MARFFGPICVALMSIAATVQAQESISFEPENNAVIATDQHDSVSKSVEDEPLQLSPGRSATAKSYYRDATLSAPLASPLASAETAAPTIAGGLDWNSAGGSDCQCGAGQCCQGQCCQGQCCQGQCQCGRVSSGDCCEACWPRWYVQAEAMFLWRNNDVRVQPVVLSSATNSTVFDTRSADFDTGIGPRALIGLRTSNCTAWECQYFSAIDMSGSASISSPGLLNAAGSFPQMLGWGSMDSAGVFYRSELHNVEINYLRSWGVLSLLGGFRFVRLSENYDLGVTQGSGSDAYNVHSENNMYGAQLGGRWRECRGRFFWDFTGKAGIFGNDANQSQYLSSGGGTQLLRNFTTYDSSVAFVGDLNLSIGFRINQVWAARCGYNVIWIDQVALAANQLDFAVNPTAGHNITSNGDIILHGINIGLEGHW